MIGAKRTEGWAVKREDAGLVGLRLPPLVPLVVQPCAFREGQFGVGRCGGTEACKRCITTSRRAPAAADKFPSIEVEVKIQDSNRIMISSTHFAKASETLSSDLS